MKKAIPMSLILILAAYGDWEAMGPEGGNVRSVCISNVNENMVFAMTYTYPAKCYRSTNAGNTWTKMGQASVYPYCMVNDNSDNLYVGYYGVYKSTNGGATWTNYATTCYAYDLIMHPTLATTVYGAGYKYVSPNYNMVFLKSTNSGVNWTYTIIATGQYCYGRAVAADPTNGNVIYVGGDIYTGTRYEPKIYKSTDGGTSFVQVFSDTVGYYVYSLAVHPTNPNIVYAGTYTGGIWRSTNAGSTWTKVSTLYYEYRLLTTPANPNLVLAGSNTAIYRSTNAGVTWTSHTAGLKGSGYFGLDISRLSAANTFVSDNAGVFKTTDTGANWQMANTGLYAGCILDFGIAPSQPATIYTEFENVGVYKTLSYGSSWTLLPTPSSCGALCSFVVNRTNPSEVYALEGSG